MTALILARVRHLGDELRRLERQPDGTWRTKHGDVVYDDDLTDMTPVDPTTLLPIGGMT